MKKIKTGADKLVEIIEETKRISLDDAAKALGTNKEVIQEWADFLEKQKLISIDYSFSKVFLTEHKMTSREIKTSAKEVVYEKDGFVRKVEFALAALEKESVNFDDIKKKFNSIHGEVKDEIKTVERELAELEKYNALKSNVDKEIEAQKNKYKKELDDLEEYIKKRETEYVDLYARVIKEKEGISEHKKRIQELKDAQDEISKSIAHANSVFVKLKEDLSHENDELNKKLKSFEKLTFQFQDLSSSIIKDKQKKISSISKNLEEESNKLIEKQNKLLNDAKAKTAKLESYEHLGKKIKGSFEGFFNKTLSISTKLESIDKDKDKLKSHLLEIQKKAKALDIMNSSSMKKQAEEIENEIKKYDESKKMFLIKIKTLFDDLKV